MKKYVILMGVILIILLGIQQYLIRNSPKKDDFLEKIESLDKKLDSINNKKDSVRIAIDSTHIKIITNEKHYQERVNTIMLQSSSADSSFITSYIRQYRNKNDSINI